MEPTPRKPEIWGGVECTVNRVGDVWFDQLDKSGHARRPGDIALFAGLGLRAIRYPVLWERTAPHENAPPHWGWADERLGLIRDAGIEPIVGLLHHGSGPRHTSLVDPRFPEKLAAYALAVAERYPWVDRYTPVNEPLTTARFSGLYGLWYPHGRDDRTFATTLVNQCRGVAMAMRAIRTVRPGAKLVQTEDLGRTYSTAGLAYQAEFENERRWLTHDLLAGRVDAAHPLRDYLTGAGIEEAMLEWFVENPTPPDVIGVNYYVTSERLLDGRRSRYPAATHGGNGRHGYADVEAVRARAEGIAGAASLMAEAWERYHIPIAVTEAHIGCRRESQMRWLREIWDGACALRAAGADIMAVTAWSLLGTYDWNSLVTRSDGHYEPGVFDLRSGSPRPTALATMLADLARAGEHDHPLLDAPGWWRAEQRLLYKPVAAPGPPALHLPSRKKDRPLMIAGAAGRLGRAIVRACTDRGITCVALARAELDCAEPASVAAAMQRHRPWGVVNAAGYAHVDDAENEPERCMRENVEGPIVLAGMCAEHGAKLLTFSTSLVFDGAKRDPYLENDPTSPLGTYGWSKAMAERGVRERLPSALVVRASNFFGPWDERNFVAAALRAMESGREFAAADDQLISPTYLPDLVHAALDLLIDNERGIWHLGHGEGLSWADLAARAAGMAGLDSTLVNRVSAWDLGIARRRPAYGVLGSARGAHLPPLDSALQRYVGKH